MIKIILSFICLAVLASQNYSHGQSEEKITGALNVRHIPNPVTEATMEREMYIWQFRTEIRNNLIVPLQITHFGFYFYVHGKWELRNFDQLTLTKDDFTQRYSKGDKVVDGWIQPGKVAINNHHWVKNPSPIAPRSKWVYTAEDSEGNIYYAEAEIELIPSVIERVSWDETDRLNLVEISGQVLDENDLPVVNAHLHLNNDYSQESISAVVTGKDGSFSLEALKPGLFRLFVFAVGHERFSIPLILVDIDQKVNFDIKLKPHDYNEGISNIVLPTVVSGKDKSALQKIWTLDQMLEKQQTVYWIEMEKYNKTHEDMREFRFDWSKTVATLKNYMEDKSDLGLRQFAAIKLGQLPTHPGVIDSNTILKIMEILPPSSKLWSAAPHLPSILVYRVEIGRQTKFLNDFVESNPDHIVRAIALAQLAMRAHFSNDKKTAALYYEKLKTEYGDIKEIQFQLSRLNPDKAIAAGKPVPDFEVKLMDNNKTVSNKSLLSTFYLIDFWAVWCAPCVQEMENLHTVFKKFNKKNFSILSLSLDTKLEDVQKFREKKWAMPWHNAFVEKGFESELAKNFDVFGIPKPIFVGPDGVILEEGETLRGENLEKSLSKYLEGRK